MIDLHDVSKVYQIGEERVHALDHVTLHIFPKEFVSVIGPSGSGKTTLMNIIGCLDVADAGTYRLDGIPIEDYSEKQLARVRNQKIGFIFQNFNLIAKLSEILGAYAIKGRVGEIRDLLLCGSAVLHYHAGVCYIDLRGEVLDHFPLLIGERGIVENRCVRSFCRSVGGSLGCCCGSVILGVECEFYLKCFVHVIHIYVSLANV